MPEPRMRMGIVGCGRVSRIHVDRLLDLPEVRIVGCADPEAEMAASLAQHVRERRGGEVGVYSSHQELLQAEAPGAVAIFSPSSLHYHQALDSLQAGCHLFVEKPLVTHAQEAEDLIRMAQARARIVAVGHQYRLRPAFVRARELLASGELGEVRLVVAAFAQPWVTLNQSMADSWRFEPAVSGGGMLADTGDHLLDILLWTTGSRGVEVTALVEQQGLAVDVVTAAAIRLANGTLCTIGVCGSSSHAALSVEFSCARGTLRVREAALSLTLPDGTENAIPLLEAASTIDANFVSAVLHGEPVCCPAADVLATVRLLEAILRSAGQGQTIHLDR